jgi:hypothetical protein
MGKLIHDTEEFKNKLQYFAIDAEVWMEHPTFCNYLTFSRNLKELAIIFHETGSTPKHEQWRMRLTDIEFHEPNAEALEDSRDYRDAFENHKTFSLGGWSERWKSNGQLSVRFMTMSRGGKMCCFEPEQILPAETETSIEMNANDS